MQIGKSTAIAMLTGLVTASNGRAGVYNNDTSTHMDRVRGLTGIWCVYICLISSLYELISNIIIHMDVVLSRMCYSLCSLYASTCISSVE
jgi:ABC-type lipopolysaccharide export system ATPase subunit